MPFFIQVYPLKYSCINYNSYKNKPMTIIILRKNPEYLGTDIFSQQMGGRKQHDGLWQFFQDLSVIRFSFTITASSDKR